MSGSRIERYSVRYFPSGETEEYVWGNIWSFGFEHYFDKFENEQPRINWATRFNQMYNTNVSGKAEIYKIIGHDNFKAFKQEWARKYLPRIDKWICVTNKILVDSPTEMH